MKCTIVAGLLLYTLQNCALGQQPAATPAPTREAVKDEDLASVQGLVVNAITGEPVRKCAITLNRVVDRSQSVGGQFTHSGLTDAAGQFSINGIEPGRYRLVVERAGFVTQMYGSRPGGNSMPSMITLAKAEKFKDLNIRLTPQGVVTGRVLDEDGDPVLNVAVNCMRQAYVRGRKQWVPVNGGNSNDIGEFRIHSLAPGRYYLSARKMDMSAAGISGANESYAVTYYPSAAAPDLATPVEVTPGAQINNIDIHLKKARTVRVRGRVIHGASGKGVQNATVRLVQRSDSFMDEFMPKIGRVMDQNGTFVAAGLAAGSYWAIADGSDEGGRLVGRTAVEVGSSNIDNIVITVEAPSELTGSVKVAGGGEMKFSGVRVQLQQLRMTGMGGYPVGSVAENGSFTLKQVLADAYSVLVTGLPDGYYVKAVRWGQADVTDSGLDLSAGVVPAAFEILVAPGAPQLDGSVQAEKQQAAASATIVVIPEGERQQNPARYSKIANADQNGAFNLKGLIPGEYRVYAFSEIEPGAWMDPEFLKPFESKGERVSLKENARESLQLKLIETAGQRQ